MDFTKINVDTFKNKTTNFNPTSNNDFTYRMFVNLDLSRLLAFINKQGLKLFPVCLYGITRIVNRHQEFRMAVDPQGNVGYFDVSNPCYTVFHEDNKIFTDAWTEYDENFATFYQSCVSNIGQSQDLTKTAMPITNSNLFNVSCSPKTSLSNFKTVFLGEYDYLQPIFTIGKSFDKDDKVLLPLAIQVHGAVCDEAHATSFACELQEWADNFAL
ncbi:MAG: CatA-like O-acetyltransferase [Oscillospiraceae bacterium]